MNKRVETDRCTGHCCEKLYIPLSPMELQFDAKRAALKKGRYQDVAIIADMVYLTKTYPKKAGRKGDTTQYVYGCRHFDGMNCRNYANRPALCSDYPYGPKPNGSENADGSCHLKGCTRRCDKIKFVTVGDESEKSK